MDAPVQGFGIRIRKHTNLQQLYVSHVSPQRRAEVDRCDTAGPRWMHPGSTGGYRSPIA